MNTWAIIILVIVAALFILACRYIKRHGTCSGCHGNCKKCMKAKRDER